MNGFEELKSQKIGELESERAEIDKALEEIATLDCGQLSKELVASITGRQEELSSRIVRGVEELHRVLRFNMLEKAGEGDIIRATLLWVGPFINDEMRNRMLRFIEAAENGAEIRYLVSSDIFKLEENEEVRDILQGMFELTVSLRELRKRGKKFNVKIYAGPKTYNQVSFNQESMALVIAENPVTATWITRKFNPDLIDNAVKTFDNDWKKAKSLENLTQEDFNAFGAQSEGLVKRALSELSKEK
jgi:hypothetical protein